MPTAQEEISRRRIAAAALAIAEGAGFEAITMRGLADRLGVSPAALYYYVANRNALTDLVVDALIARIPTDRPGPWYDRLRAYLVEAQRELLKYSGVSSAFVQQSPSAHVVDRTQYVFDTLRQAGLSQEDATVGHHALLSLFVGHILLSTRQSGAASTAQGVIAETDPSAALDAALQLVLDQLRARLG